jgi:hypothetical protein
VRLVVDASTIVQLSVAGGALGPLEGHHLTAPPILDLARQLGWAKSYDAEYVVLAIMSGSPLVTLDERLRRGVRHLVDVPLVTEIPRA